MEVCSCPVEPLMSLVVKKVEQSLEGADCQAEHATLRLTFQKSCWVEKGDRVCYFVELLVACTKG